MSTITDILGTDNITDSRAVINTNFSNLNTDKAETSAIANFETTTQLNARDTANRDRTNHTWTQTASTISDFDTEVSNNTDVSANTSARHDAVTVTDSTEIDFTLTWQDITADLKTTTVTPWSYILSAITVDSKWRITSASSWSPSWTPLTTKWDLLTFDTTDQRLAVWTNWQVLTADSTVWVWIKWATVSWSWDVVWPASAVDSNFASFDTTTWKLIKDSWSKASDFAPALWVDDNYVTDAEKVVIGNTSGTNSWNETTTTIKTKLWAATTSADWYLTSTDWNTFNSKAPALTSDDNYVTDAEKVVIWNTSWTNTWDNTVATALTWTPSITVATVTTTWNIELWNATDTTLSRVSAWVVAIEWVTIPTISSTSTLTNKRITKRVVTVTQSATPAINVDNWDIYQITWLAQAITSMSSWLTGTPVEWQMIMIQITDNWTARAITWWASFVSWTNAILPTTTVISVMKVVLLQYTWSTWKCLAVD